MEEAISLCSGFIQHNCLLFNQLEKHIQYGVLCKQSQQFKDNVHFRKEVLPLNFNLSFECFHIAS